MYKQFEDAVNAKLALEFQSPLSSGEITLADSWDLGQTEYCATWVHSRISALRSGRAVPPPSEKPLPGRRRSQRVNAIALTGGERDVLVKAIGHLLMTGQLATSHARRLLDKLTW